MITASYILTFLAGGIAGMVFALVLGATHYCGNEDV